MALESVPNSLHGLIEESQDTGVACSGFARVAPKLPTMVLYIIVPDIWKGSEG